MTKHPGGRPSKKDEETVKKLEEAFKNDFTVERACRFAGISTQTYYNWCEDDEEFFGKMERAQDFLFNLAHNKVAIGVRDGGFREAVEYLKRRDRKRYGDTVDLSGELGVRGFNVEEVIKAGPSAMFDALRAAGIGSKE